MLSAQDLALDYRTGGSVAHAVDTVSLSVEQGSFVGLIGPSGSGKSSLMYLLSGLKRPTRGSVAFGGRDYGDISTPGLIRLRRQRFGFVFQQHFLINYLSTLENVMVGAVKRNHEGAWPWLARSSTGRRWSSRMSRPPRSTREPAGMSSTCSPTIGRATAGAWSSSPTIRRC